MVKLGWLLCYVGYFFMDFFCFVFLNFITYRPLRQFVKICAGSLDKSLFIIVRIWCMAIKYALNMCFRLGNCIASLIFFPSYICRIQFHYVAKYLLLF